MDNETSSPPNVMEQPPHLNQKQNFVLVRQNNSGLGYTNYLTNSVTSIETAMNTIYLASQALVHRHAGNFTAGAFTMTAVGCSIWDSRAGRRDANNNLIAIIDSIDTKIKGLEAALDAKINSVQLALDAKINSVQLALRADIKDLGAEVSRTQSMVLEGGHHTMKALDGDKRPMREWLQRLELCKESHNEDCGSFRKA
ncbi:hypothetical protein HOY80DRAFT_1136169 [Tuber brumale]|nr:hypothetical protein HOY80DRAFT_1136169 [Tuber brumale]